MKRKIITFPSGATTAFAYLQNDEDTKRFFGSELAKVYFEECQFRSWKQFTILLSRNRSRAQVTKGIRCTLNPDDRVAYMGDTRMKYGGVPRGGH